MKRVRVRDQRGSWNKFCSWGKHYTLQVHQYPNGTMCLECQMKIADDVARMTDWPQLSHAVTTHLRNKRLDERAKRNTAARIKGRSPEEGFVYYIRINGQIKIGYAADVTARMRHYPPGSELLAVEPGSLLTEKERHQNFAPYLERGREWFGESDRLAAHVADLVQKHGDPSSLAYRYTKRNA